MLPALLGLIPLFFSDNFFLVSKLTSWPKSFSLLALFCSSFDLFITLVLLLPDLEILLFKAACLSLLIVSSENHLPPFFAYLVSRSLESCSLDLGPVFLPKRFSCNNCFVCSE